jgi:hypothetical protein
LTLKVCQKCVTSRCHPSQRRHGVPQSVVVGGGLGAGASSCQTGSRQADARDPSRPATSARCARPRLPLPRLREPRGPRRAPHPPLGRAAARGGSTTSCSSAAATTGSSTRVATRSTSSCALRPLPPAHPARLASAARRRRRAAAARAHGDDRAGHLRKRHRRANGRRPRRRCPPQRDSWSVAKSNGRTEYLRRRCRRRSFHSLTPYPPK